MGLLGSNWFVHHPPVELEQVVAAVNLDMVGRNDEDEISVVGRSETPDLVALFDRFAGTVGLKLNDDAGGGAGRSDNASLWQAGIPTASLFSGTHDDYHEPSDTAGKIVPGKVERAARLSFLVMHAIASGDSTPEALRVPDGPWDPIAPPGRVGKAKDATGGAE
jgi:Zn-dependent M28 family amino/carboxypeptidase